MTYRFGGLNSEWKCHLCPSLESKEPSRVLPDGWSLMLVSPKDHPVYLFCPTCTQAILEEKPIYDSYKWIEGQTIPRKYGADIGSGTKLPPVLGCPCSSCEAMRRKTERQ